MRCIPVLLLAGLTLAGCATLRFEPNWDLAAGLAGPANYAADYRWLSAGAISGFEQAPALLRLMVRDYNSNRQIRAIGITFFGSTVFDFVLIAEPSVPQIRRSVRIGEGTQTQALAERLVRQAYFGQPTRPETQVTKIEQTAAEPPTALEFFSGRDNVTWTLNLAQKDLCSDSDFDYQSSSAGGSGE